MPIRVLVVDDSALIRQILTDLLSRVPDIEVVGTAPDPLVAREKIKTLRPDVLTLDIEMPRMDGLTFLERLMALHPMPVIVLSTLTTQGADVALNALRLGAVDYVAKPRVDIRTGMEALQTELATKIRAAASARVNGKRQEPARLPAGPESRSSRIKVIAIGASTGGVEALHTVLTALPADVPPIMIVQHMPATFTKSFARRLNDDCALSVVEAEQGQVLCPGTVYLGNGAFHLECARRGLELACRLGTEDAVSGHRPSVDVLFRSVAASAGDHALGVILTGMGRDGTDGLLAMRQAGACTLGQDETSCVVYGMPRAAKAAGAVAFEAPLERIPKEIMQRLSAREYAR